MKRFLSFLLALCMLVSVFPATAYAAETDTMTLPAITRINPLYADVLTEADLVQPAGAPVMALSDDITYYTDTASAGQALRAGMEARQETVMIYYKFPIADWSDETWNALTSEIEEIAVAHTGVPTQGDYLWWQYGGVHVSCAEMPNDGTYYYLPIAYTVTYYTTAEQEAAVDARVDELLAELNPTGTDYEKITTVYDWICDNVEYDYDHYGDTSYTRMTTAYAALIDGTAVCQGYTVLLYRLALEMGIDCRAIPSIDEENHIWNIIELGGKYYNADATWDINYAVDDSYQYYLRCDANFVGHTRDAEYATESFYAEYPMGETDYDPGAVEETPGYTLTYVYDDSLCDLTVYDSGDAAQTPIENGSSIAVAAEGESAYAVFEVSNIAEGYRIKSFTKNERDITDGLVDGEYGSMTMEIFADTEVVLELEEIPDTLPSVSSALIYTHQTASDESIAAITVDFDDDLQGLHVNVTFDGEEDYPNYFAATTWEYSTDGETWQEMPGWGQRVDFDATWSGFEAAGVNFMTMKNYWIRVRVEGKENYSIVDIGDGYFYSIAIPVNTTEDSGETVPTETASGTCGTNLTWVLTSDGTLTISGTGAMTNYAYDSLYYNAVPWDAYDESIIKVVVEEGVTTIGAYAFYQCKNMTEIILPDGITRIGTRAFESCTSLPAITIPDSVTVIEQEAFALCTALTAIAIPGSVATIGDRAFYNCTGLKTLELGKGITAIGTETFCYCTSLESVVIPEGVTSISVRTLGLCSSLKSVWIPVSVTIIAAGAFGGSDNLTDVYYAGTADQWNSISFGMDPGLSNATIHCAADSVETASGTWGNNLTWRLTSDGVLTISGTGAMLENASGEYPWDDYKGEITALVVEEGVTTLAQWAFSSYVDLKEIVIPEGVVSIGEHAFYYCTDLEAIAIPDSVTELGDYAFQYCSGLETIDLISENLTVIGDFAFECCTALESVVIPGNVAVIGRAAFRDCTALSSVTLSEGITEIGGSAFSGCTQLREVELPDSLTIIDSSLFKHCTSLESVIIGSGVTAIDSEAFSYCESLKEITIPDSVTEIGNSAFAYCSGLTSATLGSGLTKIDQLSFRDCTSLESIVIPGNVATILGSAFKNCTSLSSATLSEGITVIGDYAFAGCTQLREVELPDSLTYIRGNMFANCTNLESVTLGSGVTRIGDGAFSYCESLKEITIPDSVTEIEGGAFSYCSGLTSVVFGSGLTEIDNNAFKDCTSLESIVIPGNVAKIGDNVFQNCTALSSVTLSEGITAIGRYAFTGCTQLREVVLPESLTIVGYHLFEYCTSLEAVTLGSGVTRIDNSAFAYCESLNEITIPAAVTSIGWCAFGYSGLETITLKGCPATIYSDAFQNVEATVYYPAGWSVGEENPNYGGTLTWIPDCCMDGHVYSSVVTAPTCTEKGYTIRSCDKCGESYYEDEVEALGHTAVTDPAVDATCTADGLTEGSHCSVCGEILTAQETVPATGHSYEDGVCTVCGEADVVLEAPVLTAANIASSGKIKVSWTAVTGAEKYTLYIYNADGTLLKSVSTTSTSLTHSTAAAGETYTYQVQANAADSGADSALSEAKSRTCDLARPTLTLSNVASSGKIKVSWTAVTGAEKYMLYIYDADGALLKTVGTASTSLTHSTAAAGETYTYKVRAVCSVAAASSAWSSTKSRTCDLARPTLTLSNVASSGKIRVSWKAVTGATKYTLSIYDADGNLLKSTSTTSTSLTHSTAVAGETYTYKVRALCGVSSAASAWSAAKERTCDLARPTITVSNVASSGKIKISWKAVAGATRYNLYIYDADGNLLKSVGTGGTSVVHSTAVLGETYTYKVRALCSIGSAASAWSAAKSRICILGTPSVSITLNDSGKPRLSWNSISGAQSYQVYYSTDLGETYKLLKTTTGRTLTHSSAESSKTYYYKVRAICSNAAAKSGLSEPVFINCSTVGYSDSYLSRSAVNRINEYRAAYGVDTLAWYNDGEAAAKIRAAEINESFDIYRPDGSSPEELWVTYEVYYEFDLYCPDADASEVIDYFMQYEEFAYECLHEDWTYAVAAYNGDYWVVMLG